MATPDTKATTIPDVLDAAAQQIDMYGLALGDYSDDMSADVLGSIATVLGLLPDVWSHHDWTARRPSSDPIEIAWAAATEFAHHCSAYVAGTGDVRRDVVHSEVRRWSNTVADAELVASALRTRAGVARRAS